MRLDLNQSEKIENFGFIRHKFQGHAFKKHFHTTYSIGLIIDGFHSLMFEKEKVILSSGEIKIINPYDIHLADGEIFWEYFNFLPTEKTIKDIAQNMCDKSVDFDIKFPHIIKDKIATKQLLNLFNSQKSSFQWEENLTIFISYIIKNYSLKSIKSVEFKKNIKHSLEFIHEHFLENISLDLICEKSGLSKYHFIKIFKQKIGITPHQYILNLKIEHAKKQIQKNSPLSQIAYECGFSDQSHFIRVFKNFHGYTPKNS